MRISKLPAKKNKLLRDALFLAALSMVLGACLPALPPRPPTGTPTAVPSATIEQASSTPSPMPADHPLPTMTRTATPLPSTTHDPSPTARLSPTARPSQTAIMAPAGWRLVWHDEFDGAAGTRPNPAYWTYDLGAGGWGNDELQYYTDRAENASLDGHGSLEIKAIKFANPKTSGLDCSTCLYSSARLVTRDHQNFTYGLFEARMRLPAGQGIWPAFWLLGANVDQVGWPQCGEIDVMENKGSQPGIIHGSLHGPGDTASSILTKMYALTFGKFTDGFHVFAVEWNAKEIYWYVDGLRYFSVKKANLSSRWVYDHPFYLILNLAVGGGYVGAPGKSTSFPQSLLVDYVRVYQK